MFRRALLLSFTVIALSLLVPTCNAQEVDFPILDVKDYGATGDGTTDDTAAILKAASDLSQMSGTLVFPAGKYVLTQSLILSTPQEANCTVPEWFLSIQGESVDSSVILWSNPGASVAVQFVNTGSQSQPACSPLQVAISNISVSWSANYTTYPSTVFGFQNISGLVATNVETVMRGTPTPSFSMPNGFSFEQPDRLYTANATFTNIYMYGQYAAAINVGGSLQNTMISGLVVEGVPNVNQDSFAVNVQSSFGSYNITIRDSNIVNSALLSTATPTQGYPAFVQISNVVVDNSQGFSAIVVNDDANVTIVQSTLIGGGITQNCDTEFYRCSSNLQLNEVQFMNIVSGIAITLSSGNFTMTDSLILNAAQFGISGYAPPSSPSLFIVADNNRFVNTNSPAAIELNYGSYYGFVFIGNSCSNSTQAGSCFTNCEIYDNSGCSFGP